jgi:mannobiose 2-epimerase
MDYGLGVLGDPEISALIAPITDAMADNLIKVAYDGHSLPAECEKGVVKENRVWWVQAETYLGFLNASLKHPEREDYRNAVYSTWNFIKEYVVDKREGSEWFWEVRKDGSPYEGEPIVEPWKCPYHNGRMCLETIRRLK